MTLTAKQGRFVQEYLIDLNATQAAIRAGYSEKGATVRGAELLANRKVASAIATAFAKRAERVEVTQDYVLASIMDTVEKAKKDGPDYSPTIVLKGAELLGKHLGMFNKFLHGMDPENPMPSPENHVTIFQLPDNGRG